MMSSRPSTKSALYPLSNGLWRGQAGSQHRVASGSSPGRRRLRRLLVRLPNRERSVRGFDGHDRAEGWTQRVETAHSEPTTHSGIARRPSHHQPSCTAIGTAKPVDAGQSWATPVDACSSSACIGIGRQPSRFLQKRCSEGDCHQTSQHVHKALLDVGPKQYKHVHFASSNRSPKT